MIYLGDARKILPNLPSDSVQSVVTSPPYWRLRDYGVTGQIGQESTVKEYIVELVNIFNQCKRILKSNGILWLVIIGDCYSGRTRKTPVDRLHGKVASQARETKRVATPGVPYKNLMGLPWLLADSLRNAGWIIRAMIIWEKTNALPEKVKDRPAINYETIFMLTKSPQYYYDYASSRTIVGNKLLRSVWTIPTDKSDTPHPARFPRELVRRCLLLSTREGDLVLDPFAGSGTVEKIAQQLNRQSIGIEINPSYVTNDATHNIYKNKGLLNASKFST